MKLIFLLVTFLYVTTANSSSGPSLTVQYEWKYFDYYWDSEERKNYWINEGLYNPKNTVPVDVDQSSDGRTFITILKNPGTPATLNVVTNKHGDGGPLLMPYPDWSWHETGTCKDIVNVFRIAIDGCNRLWVLDTGMKNNTHICPAKLYSFNLKTNELLETVVIPDQFAQDENGSGMLVTPIVEAYGKTCEDTTIYMGDPLGRALVIWNGKNFKRFEGNVFEPEEQYKTITIAGESFDLLYGTVGMDISPRAISTGHYYLSFRPLASRSMFVASTKDLKDISNSNQLNIIRGEDVLPSQATVQTFSKSGTLFYGLTKEIALGCWNINYPMQREYFETVLIDRELLQFISGMKILPASWTGGDEKILMLSDQLQKLYSPTHTDTNDIRFRVLTASVKSLIKGTICEYPSKNPEKIPIEHLRGHPSNIPNGHYHSEFPHGHVVHNAYPPEHPREYPPVHVVPNIRPGYPSGYPAQYPPPPVYV